MRRNQPIRLAWGIAAIVTVIACLTAIIGGVIIGHGKKAAGAISVNAVTVSADSMAAVKDGLVVYDGLTLIKVGADAKTDWSYMIGSGAKYEACEYGVAAWSGRSLTIIGNDGEATFSGNMDEEVLSAHVGKVYTAVVTGTPEASTIILMDNDGRRVDAHTMNDRTIVDYGYFYNNTLFWVLTLDTSGTVPACTVSTYRPGRRLVGTIADNEQVFYHVLFSAENVTCIGDTYIRTYDYSGTENASRRVLTYGWTLAAADETSNNPLMCFVPNNQYDGTHSMQDIRLIRGTTDAYMRMPFNCEALFCSGNSVYGFSKDGYIMSAAFGDKKAVARQMGIQFEKVLGVTSNGVAMLQQGNVVYFVSYQA